MKTTTLFMTLILTAAGMLSAAPAPFPLTVDSQKAKAPDALAFRSSESLFRVTFTDGATASDITGDTPFMSWSTNSVAATTSTSTYSVVSATNGIVDFTFAPAAVNYTPGRYIYEVGVLSGGTPRVYRQGVFTLQGSPYSTGADPITWTTNQNIGLITFTGTLPDANIPDAITRDEEWDTEAEVETVWSTDIVTTGDASNVSSGMLNWATMPTGLQDGDDTGSGDLEDALTADPSAGGLVITNYGTATADDHVIDKGQADAAYATAAQGATADAATQPADLAAHTNATGTSVHGLGTASISASTDFVAVTGDTMTGNLTFSDVGEGLRGDTIVIGEVGSTHGSIALGAAGSTLDGQVIVNASVGAGNPIEIGLDGDDKLILTTAGKWDFEATEITDIADPSDANGAMDQGFADTRYLNATGDDGNALTNLPTVIQHAPIELTSAATVTVSEAWSTNVFSLDMTQNVELAVSNVDTNTHADWILDVRMNSYTLSFGASITNLTNSDNFTRTNSYQSIVGNRPIYETVTEVW